MPDIEVTNTGRAPRVFYDENNKKVEIAPGHSAKFAVHEVLAKKIGAMSEDPNSTVKLGSAEQHRKKHESQQRESLEPRTPTRK